MSSSLHVQLAVPTDIVSFGGALARRLGVPPPQPPNLDGPVLLPGTAFPGLRGPILVGLPMPPPDSCENIFGPDESLPLPRLDSATLEVSTDLHLGDSDTAGAVWEIVREVGIELGADEALAIFDIGVILDWWRRE